jgi:uncharacterized protein
MEVGNLMILVAIGMTAGMLSGFIGVGGGMIIVPALVYFMGLSQFEAQGTSLALMLPPIGILAFYNYYKADQVNVEYALIIAITFILGGWLGSKIALKMSPDKVKLIFGLLMFYVSVRLIWTASWKLFTGDHA